MQSRVSKILNNVILVTHDGYGDKSQANTVGSELLTVVDSTVTELGQAYIIHDATGLTDANDDYALVFGRVFKQMKSKNVEQVAIIPKAFMRVLASVAARIGGIQLKVFKDQQAALKYAAIYWEELNMEESLSLGLAA